MSGVIHHLLTAGVPLIAPPPPILPPEINKAARSPRLPPRAARAIVHHRPSDYGYLLAYCFTLFRRHIRGKDGGNERGGDGERVMTGQFHTLLIIGFQGLAIQSLAEAEATAITSVWFSSVCCTALMMVMMMMTCPPPPDVCQVSCSEKFREDGEVSSSQQHHDKRTEVCSVESKVFCDLFQSFLLLFGFVHFVFVFFKKYTLEGNSGPN